MGTCAAAGVLHQYWLAMQHISQPTIDKLTCLRKGVRNKEGPCQVNGAELRPRFARASQTALQASDKQCWSLFHMDNR